MALMNIMDEIYHHIDNRDTDLGMYLDLEKGFDTDVLDILLFKLGEFWSGDMFIIGLRIRTTVNLCDE